MTTEEEFDKEEFDKELLRISESTDPMDIATRALGAWLGLLMMSGAFAQPGSSDGFARKYKLPELQKQIAREVAKDRKASELYRALECAMFFLETAAVVGIEGAVEVRDQARAALATDDRPFEPWDGDYEKEFYDVRLKTGEVVWCWPNAGRMMALKGPTRGYLPSEVEGIRLSRREE